MKFTCHILLLFIGISFLSCTSSNNKTKPSSQKELASFNKNLPLNFYKSLEGKIDEEDIVLNLYREAGKYSGVYYKKGIPIFIFADSIFESGAIQFLEFNLSETDQENKKAILKLENKADGFQATYTNTNQKTSTSILKENYPLGSYKFDLLTYTDSLKSNSKSTETPEAIISYTYQKANQNFKEAQWINAQIHQILNIIPENNNMPNAIKKVADQYLKDRALELKEEEFKVHFNSATELKVVYNSKGYVILSDLISEYTGGAHGNYGSTLSCFDVEHQKKMQLEDLVKIDSNELQVLLETNFRKQFKLRPAEGLNNVLFDNYLKANNNFYFNDSGLLFLYNPYEIASFAQGQIIVFISYQELKDKINPSFAKRMNLF